MIKKIFISSMLLVIFLSFYMAIANIDSYINDQAENYYIINTFEETGSKNFVTGIYLDYRLLDSIFEASILLIAVTGIIFMSKKDDQVL